MSWQTTKALSQSQGTFTINLVARRDSKGDWSDKIEAMDFVEIRASENGSLVNGQLPIVMRGFVDFLEHSLAFGSTGGPSEPRIIISGRDYAKLLIEWQVLYLWTQNNLPQLAALNNGFGLLFNYNLQTVGALLDSFFDQAFKGIVQPIVTGLQNNRIPSLPSLIPSFDLPNYEMSFMQVQSYTGSFWNLFQYFISPPFGELFIWDDDTGPTMTARMTPYRSYDGYVPSPGKVLKPSITIYTTDATSYNIVKTDASVYNYFLVWGDASQLTQQTMPAFSIDKGNGVNTAGQDLYGTRPLIVDSPWINPFDQTNTAKPNSDPFSDAAELNQWLMYTMQDNQRFKMGSMTLHGSSRYKIGQYAEIDGWNQEYYISGVSHNYQQFQTWTTQLNLVRGRPSGNITTTAPAPQSAPQAVQGIGKRFRVTPY